MAASDPSKTIGILASSLSSAFVKEALEGLEEGLKGSGYELGLFEIDGLNLAEKNRTIESIALERKVAGLAYAHMPLSLPQIHLFRDAGIPLGYLAGRMEGVDWVMVDEVKGAYEATKHLLKLGHRRLALISGPLVALESRLREDGFLRALREEKVGLGREHDIKILNYSEGEGYDAAHLLFNLPEPPTAIFSSAGDLTALGVMAAAKDRGLVIPRDLSLIGYDDLGFSATLEPPLTTVRQPLREMGRKIVSLILEAIKNGAAHRNTGELFEPQLIARLSTDEAPSS